MVDEKVLRAWFCKEVLPLEPGLMRFIRRNWPVAGEVSDLRQDVYERTLKGAQNGLPLNVRSYVYTVARNLLINRANHARVVSIEFVAELEGITDNIDLCFEEQRLTGRDELRRAEAGIALLPRRCREVVLLRKVEGFSTCETADYLGVSGHTVERQLTLGMRALVDYMLGGDGKIRRETYARSKDRA